MMCQNELMRVETILQNNDLNLFKELYNYTIPWDKTDITYLELSFMYYNHSGLKILNYPIVKEIERNDITNIAHMIISMLSKKWTVDFVTLFDLVNTPLTQVDMKKDSLSDRRNDTTKAKTENNNVSNISSSDDLNTFENSKSNIKNENESQHSDNVSETQTVDNESNQNNNSYFGFNSESASPVDNTLNQNDVTHNEINYDNTKTNNERINTEDNKENGSSTKNNKTSTNENAEKRGIENGTDLNYDKYEENNTGYDGRFTRQQILTEHLELMKNLYFDRVFDDIDKIITIPCY